jgi:hypothetical protein
MRPKLVGFVATNFYRSMYMHYFSSSVGSRTVKTLEDKKIVVDGLILESPFNNLKDEIRNHPLGLVSVSMLHT